ncbi:MAG: phosphoribosylaminoimidazolesuccinocarboxamide synthase, partial [Candidatus Limnocylindrales bacterium]
GMREGDRLPEPIFTPATKAEAGAHDENVSFDGMIEHLKSAWTLRDLGDISALAERIREVAIALYRFGAAVAERKGILLADTKFEFGIPITDGDEPIGPPEEWTARRPLGAAMKTIPSGSLASLVMLIDEALTPDSSRFWEAATYQPGGPQASFDKQFVRDWLERQPWNKTSPGPELPADVVAGTRARYIEAYERITGASFERYLREDVIAP